MRGVRLTEKQVAQLKELRARGLTGPEVAVLVGCSASTVLAYAPGRARIDRELVRELRYLDGLTGLEVATAVGCSIDSVYHLAPGRPGKVDNTALREAFGRSGLASPEVARRLGWTWERADGRLAADGARVRRTLGLMDDMSGSSGRSSRRRFIDAETAARMAEAIGVMPWEVGADGTMVA